MKIKIFVLLAIVPFVFGIEKVCAQNIDSGLVAFYPFNGDVKDYSKSALDGTPVNLKPAKGVQGNQNYAYEFNGLSSYVNCGTNNRGISSVMSISAWIRNSDTTDSGRDQIIVSKYEVGADKGFLMSITHEGHFRFRGRNGSGSSTNTPDTKKMLRDGKWHHVVAVMNGNTWELWVDCQLEISFASNSPAPDLSNSEPMIIGEYNKGVTGNTHFFYKGSIDEVRIYNRTLSQSEKKLLCDKITGNVEEPQARQDVLIYPNPNTGIVRIESEKEIGEVKIYANNGVLIRDISKSMHQLDISDLSNGMYVVRIFDRNGMAIAVEKILKN
jgi:hypothetical protein